MFPIDLATKFEIFGLIYSLILFLGLYQIGSLIFKIKVFNNIFSQISEIKYQKILISTNFILLIFYPIILYSNKINFIPVLSLSIFAFGLYKISVKFKNKFNFQKVEFKKKNIDKYLVSFCILSLFFLSLSPNTHGDSLGYHFVVAQKLLSSGKYFSDITHFHSLLAGSGEIIIAIGLFFGSEQFGSLIQFSGLISIFGLIKKINNKDKYYYLLLVITSPIILFLSSTAKPQLFHICSSAVVFALYFFINSKNLNNKDKIWRIFLALLILTVSIHAKFNFILSSSLLSIYILYTSYKDNNFKYFLYCSILIFSLFYLPIVIWKYINFGGNFYQYFYTPVPLNITGLEEFKEYLSGYGRGINYLSIIVPTNFNQFTNSIGIAFAYILILNFKKRLVRIVFIIVLLHIFMNYFFGQFIGRSFLEPLFWILLITAKFGPSIKFKIFEYLCRLQSIIVIVGILFGVITIFPGSINNHYKDIVLSKNANGYSLFKWANTKLKKDDVLFSTHRSISFGKSNYIATDFVSFVNFKDKKSKVFVEEIYNKKPKFILTYGYSGQKPILGDFKDCVGDLKYYKNSVGTYEARNPFNRGKIYDGYIFEFKLSVFPMCMRR